MWYVLKCRDGQEEALVRSCTGRIAPDALEAAFLFRCERLWRSEGAWKRVERLMFPGYVFLQSRNPDRLSEALKPYRDMHMVMEDPDYLFPVYEEEEQALRRLCGERQGLYHTRPLKRAGPPDPGAGLAPPLCAGGNGACKKDSRPVGRDRPG